MTSRRTSEHRDDDPLDILEQLARAAGIFTDHDPDVDNHIREALNEAERRRALANAARRLTVAALALVAAILIVAALAEVIL